VAQTPSVGLVGCGRWGRLILRDLLSLGAQVAVVTRGASVDVARAAGVRVIVEETGALPAVDGIVVATPTTTHADVVEALLPRGVPIYCEKPLCDDPGRARRLAVAGDGRLFVMEKWRYHRGVIALAQIARSGELGRVVGLRTTRMGYGNAHPDTDCVWNLMPHDVSIAAHILGCTPSPISAVVDRGSGQILGMTAISAVPAGPWHVAEIGVRSPQVRRNITLLCTEGSACLPAADADHLILLDNSKVNDAGPPRTRQRPVVVDMPLLSELAAFVEHLKGGPPPMTAASEAATGVEAIAQMRRLAGI
jgi:predicted dehydrogenase